MSTVIDAEFFYLHNSQLLLKEVSAFHIDTKQIQTFLIKSAIPFDALPLDVQGTNNYCSNSLHKISWDSGYVSKEVVDSILKRSLSGRSVFAKGCQKARFFSKMLRIPVYNLEKLDCPKVDEIKHAPSFSCLLPQHRNGYNHCAQVKAMKFGWWLQTHEWCFKCFNGGGAFDHGGHLPDQLCPAKLKALGAWVVSK